jgi:quercetin dioxygenase-like cupin family protein
MTEPLIDKAWVGNLDAMVEFASDGIVSKTVVDEPRTKVVLFAMETGQSLSEHTASMPATIHILQGRASLLLGGERHDAPPGTWIYMPANLNHAVDAVENVVFLLTLLRGAE